MMSLVPHPLAVPRFHMMGGAPVSADRLLALYKRLGDDDMFSSDLTNEELSRILRPVGAAPCLVLQSGSDQV